MIVPIMIVVHCVQCQGNCFKDNDNIDKYCWYPTDYLPCRNWNGFTGAGYGNCGPTCTNVVIRGGCKSVEVIATDVD